MVTAHLRAVLGVMEGKAFLMKYLGGVDAVALCVDSRDENGKNDPEKIIQFVKMLQPSFGAVNLEDISQPNCFRVLDVLREECDIPVWHDDAQGTACVTLAGLINALKLAGKDIKKVKDRFAWRWCFKYHHSPAAYHRWGQSCQYYHVRYQRIPCTLVVKI
jgi:malic enzyme